MTRKTNYLIGNAQELAYTVPPPKMNPQSVELYTAYELKQRLKPQFDSVLNRLDKLSEQLCPRGYAVTKLTLHPSYIAKGHFPRKLISTLGFRSIGSKSDYVMPDKWTRKGTPEECPTTVLYLAGKKDGLQEFLKHFESHLQDDVQFNDLKKVWQIDTVDSSSKIKITERQSCTYYEVGLHLIPEMSTDFIKTAFLKYASELEITVRPELSIEVSNLWFIPVEGPEVKVKMLADFSFVRVVRPLPSLRSIKPLIRQSSAHISAKLPTEPPLAPDLKVAILDGGIAEQSVFTPWLKSYKISDPLASDCTDGPSHGTGVTSAFLFGPLKSGEVAPRPFSYVDHIRVLDSKISTEDPLELYRTLTHIEDVLLSRQYEFINISLGPELSVDDDEIHPWTSLIDQYLSDGETFLTIAAGNNGQNDPLVGLNRIQVPSDCVNAIAVGSASSTCEAWNRSSYSAVGPGRAPGLVKPDLLAFGGEHNQYFHVLGETKAPTITPQMGTSYASPYLLRKAVGIKAILGHEITPLAIKALLINSARQKGLSQVDVGWGKIPDNLPAIIQSPDGVAKILYQGELSPGKYLRVPLPIPKTGILGNVRISATCCIASPVDPQDTSMYTKAGVEISWLPNKTKKKESFFQQVKIATEAELRRDAAKWESVLHAEKTKRGTSLVEPSFEIHYVARDGGDQISGTKAPKIKYAFLVTLDTPKHETIFSDILNSYTDILTEIEPRISTSIQIET
ncbi:subtilisin-like serine protease [Rheinheimera sp. A13L]|uniref:S8 family peptidase n=1 Tax=Rheinheimera sp. A13L TaxID=506534 RepID=UPI0002124CD6|nr:S8 family peptidase [Rheinheimera sp. A13L]EGM79743.1 subtilisin-like serine protease [Rheinheimera sp. A13L]